MPLDLGAVHVREPAPPPGVAPVEWTLLANLRPDDPGAGLAAFADRVVDYYAVRPTIEEFHKGLPFDFAQGPAWASRRFGSSRPTGWSRWSPCCPSTALRVRSRLPS